MDRDVCALLRTSKTSHHQSRSSGSLSRGWKAWTRLGRSQKTTTLTASTCTFQGSEIRDQASRLPSFKSARSLGQVDLGAAERLEVGRYTVMWAGKKGTWPMCSSFPPRCGRPGISSIPPAAPLQGDQAKVRVVSRARYGGGKDSLSRAINLLSLFSLLCPDGNPDRSREERTSQEI